jgi:hypothetical protein
MMEKIFDASILSWKTITATTGTIGSPTAVMELENTEEDSKINPTQPTVYTCQKIAAEAKVKIYDTFPSL